MEDQNLPHTNVPKPTEKFQGRLEFRDHWITFWGGIQVAFAQSEFQPIGDTFEPAIATVRTVAGES